MRVGILTFHCACNYGAVLQCYALQRFLVESGHDAIVVDYRPAAVADGIPAGTAGIRNHG